MYSFNNILGHDEVIKHMKSAFVSNKISHAYVIEGDEGIGKKTIINAFVKLLQCEAPKGSEPCHECPSCQQIQSGNHPDTIFVSPSKKTGYGVSDIRDQVVKDISIKPYKSKYKIYIIDEADMMSIQAQNSMLKTIEEPPEYGLFFLLATNSQRFLQTILSRVVKITLKPIGPHHIESYLINEKGSSVDQAKLFTSFSRGNLGKALILKESDEFLDLRRAMLKCLTLFIKGKEYDIMEAVKILEDAKNHINDSLELLVSLIRDVMYYQATSNLEGLIHQDMQQAIVELAEKGNGIRLLRLNNNICEVQSHLRLNVNYGLSMLVMLTDANRDNGGYQ